MTAVSALFGTTCIIARFGCNMASAPGGEKKLLWSGQPVEERLYRDPKKLGPVPNLYRIVIDIFFEHAEVVIARPATNDNS